MRKFQYLFLGLVTASSPALAGGATVVPEIGTVGGIGVALAVGAVVAFVWERRRNR